MASTFHLLAVKGGTVITSGMTAVGFCFSIVDRYGANTASKPNAPLGIAVELAILCAIGYGILWTIPDKWIFKWQFEGGTKSAPRAKGERHKAMSMLPSGFSAVVLSLSVTIPLAVVPYIYQNITGSIILPTKHWQAVPVLLVCGALGHVVLYGWKRETPNGLRNRIMPATKKVAWTRALEMEAVYAAIHFSVLLVPYRLLTYDGETPFMGILLLRIVLPALVFFLCMTAFILLRYPESLNDKSWVLLRGFFSALVMMFCLTGGMFL